MTSKRVLPNWAAPPKSRPTCFVLISIEKNSRETKLMAVIKATIFCCCCCFFLPDR